MYGAALTVAWVVGVGYASVPSFWLMIHGVAEKWRARARSPYRVLLPAWALIILALGALTWPWRSLTLYRTPWSWPPATVLIVAGLILYRVSHQGFTHQQLTGRPEVERGHEQRLVTGGIRSRVRHPVYLAGLCVFVGWTVGSGLVVLYCLLAYTLVTGAIMLRQEERELQRRFGEAYRAYKQMVPAAIIPRPFSFHFHSTPAKERQ